jgi:hypothetical protein
MPLADEREWRERLVAATARAIVQLRGHDDLTTWRLVADLDALRRRLLTQLEQEAANLLPSLAVTEPGRDSAA